MAQIPTTPQIAGGNTPALTPAEGETGVFSLAAEGMALGIPFNQTLQQLLESQDQDPEGVLLLLAMNQPLENEVPLVTSSQNGNILPLSLQSDGKALPPLLQSDGKALPPLLQSDGKALPLSLQSDGKALPLSLQSDSKALPLIAGQPLPVETESLTPVLSFKPQAMLQPEVAMQRLISGEKPINLTSTSMTEDGKLLLEAMRGTETATLPSLNTTQMSQNANATLRPSVVLPLNVPVGQPGWDKAVGERIQWMVNQNVQQAEIKLTPPNLGPIEIKISMHNDQTNVVFSAIQAPTREALEASIPRLREMFGDINLNLANVDVGHRQAGESGGEATAGGQQEGGAAGEHNQTTSEWSREAGRGGGLSANGLLDTYA